MPVVVCYCIFLQRTRNRKERSRNIQDTAMSNAARMTPIGMPTANPIIVLVDSLEGDAAIFDEPDVLSKSEKIAYAYLWSHHL